MEFFDKVKNVAGVLAEKGGRKSKELYGIAKIKVKIAEKQGNVKNLYKEVGYNAFRAYKAETDVMEAINQKLEEIDALEVEIAELRNEIEGIKEAENLESEDSFDETIEVEAQRVYDEADKEPLDTVE